MSRLSPISILLFGLVCCYPQGGRAVEPYAIKIGVVPGRLLYDVVDFEVAAGSPVKVTFDNNGLMPHNVLFTRPGKAMEVVNAAMAMGADGYNKGYVPESGQLLASSRLLEAGQKQTLEFAAPAEPGDYPFVCTFPGHGNIMQGVMRVVAVGAVVKKPQRRKVAKAKKRQGPPDDGSGVTPRPMGSRENPLVMRTFMPNPIRERTVFPNHHRGKPTPTYSPDSGRDSDGYIDTSIGFPAAVGISFGEELSVCWDTTECRFMYAWRGGFLNMENYWGPGTGDRRKSFDYVPHLEGRLVFLAGGPPPLALTPGVFGAPRYKGFRLRKDGVPEFLYSVGSVLVAESVEPGETEGEIRWHFSIQHAPAGVMLGFDGDGEKRIRTADGKWNGKVLTIDSGAEQDFTLLLEASQTVLPQPAVLPAVGGVVGGAKSSGPGAEQVVELEVATGALQRGLKVYADSAEILGSVPEQMRGSDLVRTRSGDRKTREGLVYEVQLKGEAGVFVLTDGKSKERPDWLDVRFSDSGLRVPVSGKRFYRVWSALLPAGGHRFQAVTGGQKRLQIVVAARKK